jgi:integrase
VTLQTRHQYAKTLATVAKQLGLEVTLSQWYRAGLADLGALIAQDPAVPATKQQVDYIRRVFPPIPAAVLLLCWKTASRFDDVRQLKKDNFLLISPKRLIIRWGKTKANREALMVTHSLTVVDDVDGLPELVRHLARLKRGDHFTTLSDDRIRAILKRYPMTRELTLHSFKRGAADVLIREVVAGNLDIELLPRLLKHKHAIQELPEVTVKYLSDHINLALALRTDEATKLL